MFLQVKEVSRAWEKATKGGIYAVTHKNQGLYTESAEEQGLDDGLPLLRVFLTYDEANRYREVVEEYLGQELVVQAFTLDELWIQGQPQQVRVAICHMPESEWPTAMDTLWGGSPGLPN